MTIISSEVDSPSTWERPRKIVSAGTKRTPPPTPTMPPVKPPAIAIRAASSSFTTMPRASLAARRTRDARLLAPRSLEHQLDRDRDQQRREEERDGALGDALLHRGPDQDAADRGDREQ